MLEFSWLLRMITVLVAGRSISAPKTKEFIQSLFKLLKQKRGLSISSDGSERACISMDDNRRCLSSSKFVYEYVSEYGCFIARKRELHGMISGIKLTVSATGVEEAWQVVTPPGVHRNL